MQNFPVERINWAVPDIHEALGMSWNSSTSRRHRRATTHGALAMAAAVMLSAPPVWGQEALAPPQGPAILTVEGNIAVTNGEGVAAFDRDMFLGLGATKVTTTTPWTDGPHVFSGVLARTVFEKVGAEGTVVLASALNDYTVEIPMSDFQDYDVLLATEMDGEQMQVSDKGPIWIVYPRDDEPALQDRRVNERWVWQLKALRVQ